MADLLTIIGIIGAILGFVSFNDNEYDKQILKLKILNEKKAIVLLGILGIVFFVLESSPLALSSISSLFSYPKEEIKCIMYILYSFVAGLFLCQVFVLKYKIRNFEEKPIFRCRSFIKIIDVEKVLKTLISKGDYSMLDLFLNHHDIIFHKQKLLSFKQDILINSVDKIIFNDDGLLLYLLENNPSIIPLLLDHESFKSFLSKNDCVGFYTKIKENEYPSKVIDTNSINNLRILCEKVNLEIASYKMLDLENKINSQSPKNNTSKLFFKLIIDMWISKLSHSGKTQIVKENIFKEGIKYLIRAIISDFDKYIIDKYIFKNWDERKTKEKFYAIGREKITILSNHKGIDKKKLLDSILEIREELYKSNKMTINGEWFNVNQDKISFLDDVVKYMKLN